MFEIDESPKNQRVSQLGVIFLTRQCHKNALCTSEHVKICVQFCTNCVDILCGVHSSQYVRREPELRFCTHTFWYSSPIRRETEPPAELHTDKSSAQR
jgi:hypothetical protein